MVYVICNYKCKKKKKQQKKTTPNYLLICGQITFIEIKELFCQIMEPYIFNLASFIYRKVGVTFQ